LTVAGWQLLDVQVQGQTGATSTYDVAPSGQTVSLTTSDAMVNLSGANDVVTASGDSNTIAITGANETVTLTGVNNTVTSSIADTSLDLTATDSAITLTATDSTITLAGSGDTATLNIDPTTVIDNQSNSTQTFIADGTSIQLTGGSDDDTLTFAGNDNTIDYSSQGSTSLPDPIVVNITSTDSPTTTNSLTIKGSAKVASASGEDRIDVTTLDGTSGAPVNMTLTLEGGITGAARGIRATTDDTLGDTSVDNITITVDPNTTLAGAPTPAFRSTTTARAISRSPRTVPIPSLLRTSAQSTSPTTP
jgi:hypothetical protein